DTDVGTYDAWWWNHPPMYQEKGLYRPYCKMVKEAVDVPVLCAGRMDDPEMASASIENGDCDMISLGRPLLADPDYVNKLRAGRVCEIRPCISCQEGCMGRIQEYSMINCAVNPQAARERVTAYEPVVGITGQAVEGRPPGRQLIPGGAPGSRRTTWRWRNGTADGASERSVRLNTEVTKRMCWHTTRWWWPPAPRPGIFLGDDGKVYTAAQVLTGEKDCGDETVVIGGGLVGCETALWLAQHGKR
ncbi:MAG: 2-enoate reductase, partial [Neglectibacter sp.]